MSLYVIGIILCCGLIGAVSASAGVYAVLQKKSLLTDAISHALLPGIMVGFLLGGGQSPWWISIFGCLTGLAAAYLSDWLQSKSPLSTDASIGISLSVFFGLGVCLLSYVQQLQIEGQSSLMHILLGNAASMQERDLWFFGILTLLVLAVNRWLHKEFALLCFNPDYAESIGLPVARLRFVLRTLTVLTIVAGIQAVGVVLMASCLIVPSIAAQYWSYRMKSISLIAIITGCLSGTLGAFISYIFDHVPTGPIIVIILSFLCFLSVLIGSRNGMWHRYLRQRKNESKIQGEHLLKTIYHLSNEKLQDIHAAQLRSQAGLSKIQFARGLSWLKRSGLVSVNNHAIKISEATRSEAGRIVRLHRLWELYLLKRLNLPADHVHEHAEQIEHVLSPKLEAALLKDLSFPTHDPHNSEIPNA